MMQQEGEIRSNSSVFGTFYRRLVSRKLKLIGYVAVSVICALLLTLTFGENYDGKLHTGRVARKRPVRSASDSASNNDQIKDPYAKRPRIATRNGHLLIEASQDKNIDFKTSGSRGTVTINGHKLDQLLDVTKALERSVLDGGKGNKEKGLFGSSMDDSTSGQFEVVLRDLLKSSDKLSSLEKKISSLSSQVDALMRRLSKLSRKASKGLGTLKRVMKQQELTERKLKRNDCFNAETGQPVCKNGATCIDSYDGFKCLCSSQFEGSTCEQDVDECSKFHGTDLGCQNGARCVNLIGGYKCECPPQYHGVHCTEQHDDCSLSTSRSLCGNGKCINLARNVPNQARYECACEQGWTTDGVNPACVIDINECLVGSAFVTNSSSSLDTSAAWSNSLMAAYPCSQNPFVECINLSGSFQCGPCPAGYTGNGRVCRDIDECAVNNGGCSTSPLVECVNTQGSHRCASCPPGYAGDGTTCTRVSACSVDINGGCHPMAKCVELNGVSMNSRICVCNYPFVGDGVGMAGCALSSSFPVGPTFVGYDYNTTITTQVEPTKQDDCNPNPCLNSALCQRTDSSFECICPIGWSGRLCEEMSSVCGGKYFVSKGGLTFPRGGSFLELIKIASSEQSTASSKSTGITKHYNCLWTISVTPSSMSIQLALANIINLNNPGKSVQYWLANSTTSGQIQVPSCTEYLDIRELFVDQEQQQNENPQVEPVRKLLAKICIDGRKANLANLPSKRELSLFSESNTAELEYSFSATRTQFGEPSLSFALNWTKTEPPCGGDLGVAEQGSISSPKFPDFYKAGSECRYLIRVPTDKRIRIQFGELNLLTGRQHSEGSCADSLTILDGSFGLERPVLFKHCANNVTFASKMQQPNPIVSSSSTVELVFISQYDSTTPLMKPKQKRGFYLTYASEPTTPGCGGLYTAKSAIIKSSDYEPDISADSGADDPRQIVQLSYYLENADSSYSSAPASSNRSAWSDYMKQNSSKKFAARQSYKVRCEYEIRPANQARNHKISLDWLELPRHAPLDTNSLTMWSRRMRCARNRLVVYDGNPLDGSNRTELATFCAGDKYNASLPLFTPIVSSGHVMILVYETSLDPNAIDRNAQLLADSVGSTFPTGFKLHYSTICTSTYYQLSDRIQVEIEEEVPECIYHIVLPANNTISLLIQQRMSEPASLADGSCAVQAILMDGAVQGGKLALVGAERQLKTYSFEQATTTPASTLYQPEQLPLKLAARAGDTSEAGSSNSADSNSYWQYSSSAQSHDIKEFEVCSSLALGFDSVWNHLSLLFRLKPDQSKAKAAGLSAKPATLLDEFQPINVGKVQLLVRYQAEPSCGGIIVEPREGSIKLDATKRIVNLNSFPLTANKYDQWHQQQFINQCAWILKAPTNQQIQLKFDTSSLEIQRRFNDWLSWSKKQQVAKGAKVKSNDEAPSAQSATFNCAQVYEEMVELYEPSLNRTRHICPNDLNPAGLDQTQQLWSTQSNIVYIRLRNSSELTDPPSSSNNTVWPGKKPLLNGSNLSVNYKFVWTTGRQCGGRLIQDSGVITSPMYPYNYPSLANCVWIIQVNPSQQIRLNFTKFEIEKQRSCTFDYLELRNGPSDDSPLIGRFCNQELQSRVIVSHSSYMWLHFKSDTSLNRLGFELYFDGAQTGCGGRLRSTSGQIDSPNYPLPIGHSSDCEWTIEVAQSNKIELTIQDLDLSSESHDCRVNGTKTDYLEIFDSASTSGSLGRFCHKSQLNKSVIVSSTNKLHLEFKSQALDNSRGFRLTYKTYCNPIELVGFQGVIESPGFPTGYQAHSNCAWTIRAPLGSNLSIAITDLDLEDNLNEDRGLVVRQNSTTDWRGKCREDMVEIYAIYPPALQQDNSSTFSTLNASALLEAQQVVLIPRDSKRFKSKIPKYGKLKSVLCGSVNALAESDKFMILNTNLVHINFESDRSVEFRGFRIEWKAQGCGGQQMDSSSSVVSYHEQKNQNKPTECLWTFDYTKTASHLEFQLNSDMRVPDSNRASRDPCEDASLIIYDGLNDKSPVLLKNCDSQNARETLVSSSGQALVRFYTSGQHNYGRGFVLDAFPARGSSCLSSVFDLSTPFNQLAAVKKSPRYPELYDASPYACYGLLTSQRGGRVKFTVDELNIPIDSNGENSDQSTSGLLDPDVCRNSTNYFKVRTPMSKSLEQVYCGRLDKSKEKDLARSSLVIEEASVWEEFYTKGGFRGRWQVSYTRLCGSLVYVDNTREFTSPNYPSKPNWPKSATEDTVERSENVCIWNLRSRSNRDGGKLYLNVINFVESQDNNKRASSDCLRVYEGVELSLRKSQFNLTDMDTKFKAKIKICKQSDIKHSNLQYASTSNELFVVISGNAIAKLMARPFENGCGGEYHLQKSEFASLGYPQPYPELLDCHYFIKGAPGSRMNLKFLAFDLPEGELVDDDPSWNEESKCDNVDYIEIRQLSVAKRLKSKLAPLAEKSYSSPWSDLGFLLSMEQQTSKQVSSTSNQTGTKGDNSTQANSTRLASLTPARQRLFEVAKLYYLFEELYNRESHSVLSLVSLFLPLSNKVSTISLVDYYENSKLLGRFCGKKAPKLDENLLFDEILVRFRSQSNSSTNLQTKKGLVAPRGFLAEYEIQYGGLIQVLDKDTMEGGGFISSPSYPSKVRFKNSITWSFETKLNSILQFDLINLDLGSPHQDCLDSLSIYDGSNIKTSVRLSQVCGHLKFKSFQYFGARFKYQSSVSDTFNSSFSLNALPVYEALDPKVKSSLIRSIRTSSNVAKIVYDNFESEGSFLLRYKAIDKSVAKEQARNSTIDSGGVIDENEVLQERKQDFVSVNEPSKICSNTYQLTLYDAADAAETNNKNGTNSSQVILMTPNYPQQPKQAVECHWLVYTQDDANIKFSIDPSADLSNASDEEKSTFAYEDRRHDYCLDPTRSEYGRRSYIAVHDGASRLSPTIARYCLPAPPVQLQSSGRHMLIRYVHASFNQKSQSPPVTSATTTAPPTIEPRYYLFRGRASVGQCGGQYHVVSGAKISDRSSGKFYSNNLNCKYHIYAANQDKVLTILASFSEFDLAKEPTNENCTVGDYIEIRDLQIQSEEIDLLSHYGPSRSLGRFCAGRKLVAIESPGSAISIEFKTDGQNVAKGWDLWVMSGAPRLNCPLGYSSINADEPFGRFTSPNWPHGFTGKRHCRYQLQAPANQSILITFIRLNRPLLGQDQEADVDQQSLKSNKCADNFSYLADNEVTAIRYDRSPLRDLQSPISGTLLRDFVKPIPCRYAPNQIVTPTSDHMIELSVKSSTGDSGISPDELANILGIDSSGFKKLSSDEYYKLIQKAPSKPIEIRTYSRALLLDYETKSLQPKEGFVAVYRSIDDRKFKCGGELSHKSSSSASNLFESANFNVESQASDEFIQCDWSLENLAESSLDYSSPVVRIGLSMVPTASLGNISSDYLVFQTLEIPPLKAGQNLFDESSDISEKERLNDVCGLNRLLLTDNFSTQSLVAACGNLTNVKRWHILNYGERKLSLRTKNLRSKTENKDSSIYRGVRGFLYEKNCLQIERILGEGVRLRSHRGYPNSSYTPGICRWNLLLDGGNYELSFEKVQFRPPENYVNKSTEVCDTGNPDLDYIELRTSDNYDSPVLARYCIYNQLKEKEKAFMLNMRAYIVVIFVAGIKQLSVGSEEFNITKSDNNSKQNFGFDMEIVKVSNETLNDFCRRDRRDSIYWFIRNQNQEYYDTSVNVSPSLSFLYPKNAHCIVDISVDEDLRFNMSFRGIFDLESSKDCQNDYIQVDNLRIEEDSTPIKQTNKTQISLKPQREPSLSKIGRWCGRTRPKDNFLSNSNSIRITFRSNERVEGKGFTLYYSTFKPSSPWYDIKIEKKSDEKKRKWNRNS